LEPIEAVQSSVKQNLVLIRVLMIATLAAMIGTHTTGVGHSTSLAALGIGVLALSFVPFFFLTEERLGRVRFQYIFFTMDLVLLLGTLYIVGGLTTPILLCVFLTLFMSALSQSIGRSIAVAFAVIGLFYYLSFLENPHFQPLDPFFLLICALHQTVAVHSGYLAYRAVEEEKELVQLARKATFLTEKVKEAGQAGQEYAMTFKKVLDSLPLGAIAISPDGVILLVNASVGKILGVNIRAITNMSILKKGPLQEVGERMAQALRDKQEIKREYLDMVWDGKPKRFRLDSTFGKGSNGETWGMLFLVQEAVYIPPPG